MNRFSTGGTLTTSDIQNQASYSAKSAGINLGSALSLDGKLAPSGTSAGIGKDSGAATSTTRAGISGIAGNQNARTGDAQSGIAPIFDADKVQKNINAQAAITQAFGQQASKAIGDYAQTRLAEAGTLRRHAQNEADPDLKAQHLQQARQLEADWGETGTRRILAHTLVGGLTGGVQGAGGAVAGTFAAPLVADTLNRAGIEGPLAGTLTALASTAAGAAVGGTAGAGAAMNEVANNYLNHVRPAVPALSEKERYEYAATACKGGDTSACTTRDALAALSQQRDRELRGACGGGTPGLCQEPTAPTVEFAPTARGRNPGRLGYATRSSRTTSSPAEWVLGDELAQGGIHAGLPTLAGGLEGFQQVSVQANRSEHLGFVGFRATAWALHGDQRGIGLWRERFAGGLGLGEPFLRQFRVVLIGGDACIDGSGFVVVGDDRPRLKFRHSSLPLLDWPCAGVMTRTASARKQNTITCRRSPMYPVT